MTVGKHCVRIVFVTVMTWCCWTMGMEYGHAQEEFLTVSGEYAMGEGETAYVAKERADVQAMQAAVEEAKEYGEYYFSRRQIRLTYDELEFVTAGLVEVLDKKVERKSVESGEVLFRVTITARINWNNAIDFFQQRQREKSVTAAYNVIRSEYARNMREIEDLKRRLKETAVNGEKNQLWNQIAANEKAFTAVQWFARGYDFQVNRADPENAIIAYSKAIELDGSYAEVYNNRGFAYHLTGRHDLAIADYDRAVAINPQYAEAYSNRGNAYYMLGRYDKARADYHRAAQTGANNDRLP